MCERERERERMPKDKTELNLYRKHSQDLKSILRSERVRPMDAGDYRAEKIALDNMLQHHRSDSADRNLLLGLYHRRGYGARGAGAWDSFKQGFMMPVNAALPFLPMLMGARGVGSKRKRFFPPYGRRTIGGRGVWEKVKKGAKYAALPAALLAGAYAYNKGIQGGLPASNGATDIVKQGFANLKGLQKNLKGNLAAKTAAKVARLRAEAENVAPSLSHYTYD